MQLNLLAKAGLHFQPERGRTEPRLWIRRFVLWSEPGTILREIKLRPGLNIIWSPDPGDHVVRQPTTTMGHGSGKTLFCRLLRYCLGEDHFAPDEQRHRITTAFPRGMVGAEVRVGETTWAIRRPIGMGRQHFAIHNGILDDIGADSQPTGMDPFLEFVEGAILSKEVLSLIPGDSPLHAWLIALAWLARDQECRFDHVLDWRSSTSDSGSPARTLSFEQRLDALRALIQAIVPEEHRLRAEIRKLEAELQNAEQEANHCKWAAEQLQSRLLSELGILKHQVPPGRLAVDALRKAAEEKLTKLIAPDSTVDSADINDLRNANDDAQKRVNDLADDLTEVGTRIPEIERMLSRIRGELPGTSFAIHEAQNPICPICEVPINRTLAEGCKLSDQLPNPEQLRERWERRCQEVQDESHRLEEHKERIARITIEIAIARKRADEIRGRLQVAEGTRDAQADAWFHARRLIDDVGRWDALLTTQEQAQSTVANLADAIAIKRQQTGEYRDAQAVVFRRLSEIFDAIIGDIVGQNAQGKVSLDGTGLHLSVEMGGERSTAAIDSLKILAFDLAVLCMSIEGVTHVPAFLMHDSPREADLGQSLYHKLFRLAQRLEQVGTQPLFQYIVTTTTPPPKELSKAPWLIETLGGTPAEARLLKRDL